MSRVVTVEHVLCSMNDISVCDYSRGNNLIRPAKFIVSLYMAAEWPQFEIHYVTTEEHVMCPFNYIFFQYFVKE
jgi:hypothetical protein